MIVRYCLSGLLCLAIAFIGSGCMRAENAPPVPLPPCPAEEDDGCILRKGQQFALAVEDRNRPDFLLVVYQHGCGIPDADGCFMLGSVYSGSEAVRKYLPKRMLDALPIDLEKARAAYKKSCDLKSALGCATLARFLAPDIEDFQPLAQADQIEVLNSQKASCDLGMTASCAVYLDFSREFDPENWPEGPRAYMLQERDMAHVLCAEGELNECFAESISLILSAKYEPYSQEDYDAGRFQLRSLCDGGYEPACSLQEKLSVQ